MGTRVWETTNEHAGSRANLALAFPGRDKNSGSASPGSASKTQSQASRYVPPGEQQPSAPLTARPQQSSASGDAWPGHHVPYSAGISLPSLLTVDYAALLWTTQWAVEGAHCGLVGSTRVRPETGLSSGARPGTVRIGLGLHGFALLCNLSSVGTLGSEYQGETN